MDMQATSNVDRRLIAHDFLNATHGKVDDKTIQATINSLMDDAGTNMYAASCTIASGIFALKFTVHSKHDDKTFDGTAGAIATAGGGAMWGTIYTKDIEQLYEHTHAFEFQGMAAYLSLLFFDHHSNLLGHFQSGGISNTVGVGGGTGSWR